MAKWLHTWFQSTCLKFDWVYCSVWVYVPALWKKPLGLAIYPNRVHSSRIVISFWLKILRIHWRKQNLFFHYAESQLSSVISLWLKFWRIHWEIKIFFFHCVESQLSSDLIFSNGNPKWSKGGYNNNHIGNYSKL